MKKETTDKLVIPLTMKQEFCKDIWLKMDGRRSELEDRWGLGAD